MKLKPYSFRHDGCTYIFSTDAQESHFKSQLAGRKVYEDFEVCDVHIPSMGPPKQANRDMITQDWLAMKDGEGRIDAPGSVFRDHYERWKAGAESAKEGTPLSVMGELTAAQIKTLEASKIDTLEELAQMDPSILSKAIGPSARTLVEKAKDLTKPIDRDVQLVRAENLKMKDQMEAQASQMDDMRKQLAALTAGQPKKGRTKAEEAEAA